MYIYRISVVVRDRKYRPIPADTDTDNDHYNNGANLSRIGIGNIGQVSVDTKADSYCL